MSWCSWRIVNKIQTFLIPPLAIPIMLYLRDSIPVIMGISLWTWWLAAAGAWRSDE